MLAGTAVVSVVAPRIFLPERKILMPDLMRPYAQQWVYTMGKISEPVRLSHMTHIGVPLAFDAYIDPKMVEILVKPLKAAQIYEGMLVTGKGFQRVRGLLEGHD